MPQRSFTGKRVKQVVIGKCGQVKERTGGGVEGTSHGGEGKARSLSHVQSTHVFCALPWPLALDIPMPSWSKDYSHLLTAGETEARGRKCMFTTMSQ